MGGLGFVPTVSDAPPHVGDPTVVSRDRFSQQRPDEDVNAAHAPAVAA